MFHTFWPLTTHSSPSRTARVESDARSEPAPGSLNSWHHTSSPVNSGRSSLRRSSSVPWVTIVGAARNRPKKRPLVGPCSAGGAEPLLDLALQRAAHAEPAEALREVDPGEAEVVLRAAELDGIVGRRVELGEQLVEAGRSRVALQWSSSARA